MLREYMAAHPRDAAALRLTAETSTRLDRREEAEFLLEKCLAIDPQSAAIRYDYAQALLRTRKFARALSESERLLEQEPRNPLFRIVRALTLADLGDYVGAAMVWRELVTDYPERPPLWLKYAYALRATGARDACIAAYRKATDAETGFGSAYWGLANLQNYRFSDAEMAEMESHCNSADCSSHDRIRVHFSLGKAYAGRKLYEKSFAHFATGNAMRRVELAYDPDVSSAYVARCRSQLDEEFFRARAGMGCQSREPIFLVGMMRAGSTLIEQILASHSQVEGTAELFETNLLIKRIQAEGAKKGSPRVPEALQHLDAAMLRNLGQSYLDGARVYRKTARPYFTDKMGGNFAHLDMLQLILPNARIVDVRRHPLACGFSIFSELFVTGQEFSYRLADIGRLYRDYVELTAHFDKVFPGRVHRVYYERLIEEPEAEIRRLLDYLDLPFEPACLEFHKTDRVVTTRSSEQVRSPIYRDALEQWRHYEQWLGPLKTALGPVLDCYPDVPAFG